MNAALLIVAAMVSGGLDPAPPGPPYVAPRLDKPIRIDGTLDDAPWAGVPESTPFRLNKSAERARLETTLRLAHDAESIIVGLRCDEPDPDNPVSQPRDPRDVNIWGDDSLELFFDPGQTRSRYYQLIVNARGEAVAGWNGLYAPAENVTTAVATTQEGFELELRIPIADIGVAPRPGDLWGFDVFRTRRPRQDGDFSEQQAWHPTRSGYRKPHLFGELLFAGRLPLDLLPARFIWPEMYRRLLDEANDCLDGRGRWTPDDVSQDMAAERAARLLALAPRLARLGEPVLVGRAEAITDDPIFPWTVPARDELDPTIDVAVCPGEFEPASFTLFAARDLAGVTLEPDTFVGEDGRFVGPRMAGLDIRQVLCWYQSGWAHVTRDARTLVPELLVKDASLVEVDPQTRENRLGFKGLPHSDAVQLQPFDLPAFETRQIWLTFRPPPGTPPGVYHGGVWIVVDGRQAVRVPVRLEIYPFELAPSVLDYSLYYRLRPSKTDDPVATMSRMAAEIRNQVEHGINMPSTYIGGEPLTEGGPPMETLEELTDIYRELGLRDHPLILVTTAVGRQSEPEQLEKIRTMARRYVEWARDRGYSDVYFQGIDEGDLETLRKERQAFQAVHEGGGKVFVACGADYFDVVGDLLDMPVLAGVLRPDVAARARAKGHRVFSYYNPQAGIEFPLTYRRNYGLELWLAGYNGGFNYEYQTHDPELAWDEFASDHYRNHTMAYPTRNAPIDTRQWEGWREGVDDVRYVSTLLAELERVMEAGGSTGAAREAETWLTGLTGEENLDDVRREIARRIVALRKTR